MSNVYESGSWNGSGAIALSPAEMNVFPYAIPTDEVRDFDADRRAAGGVPSGKSASWYEVADDDVLPQPAAPAPFQPAQVEFLSPDAVAPSAFTYDAVDGGGHTGAQVDSHTQEAAIEQYGANGSAFDSLIAAPPIATLPHSPSAEPAASSPAAFAAAGLGIDQIVFSDPRFQQALQQMQDGAWPEVKQVFQSLSADYPTSTILASLLDEATLKTNLMERWAGQIKGRRFTVAQARLLRRSLPYALLMIFFVCGWFFYQSFVAPSRHVVALVRADQDRIDEAQQHFRSGDYMGAVVLYDEVLKRNAGNAAAQSGRNEAIVQLNLAVAYDMALQVAKGGNVDRALRLLAGIKGRAPTFRDVDAQISRLQAQRQLQQLFDEAELAYTQQRWLDAAQRYEQIVDLDDTYRNDQIRQRLAQLYLPAARDVLNRWPDDTINPRLATDYLHKAAATDPAAVQAELDLLDAYTKGERVLQSGDTAQAVSLWRPIYDQRPNYLGGYVAQQLYRSYLELGAQAVDKGDKESGKSWYRLGVALPVHDSSEIQTRLRALEGQS